MPIIEDGLNCGKSKSHCTIGIQYNANTLQQFCTLYGQLATQLHTWESRARWSSESTVPCFAIQVWSIAEILSNSGLLLRELTPLLMQIVWDELVPSLCVVIISGEVDAKIEPDKGCGGRKADCVLHEAACAQKRCLYNIIPNNILITEWHTTNIRTIIKGIMI